MSIEDLSPMTLHPPQPPLTAPTDRSSEEAVRVEAMQVAVVGSRLCALDVPRMEVSVSTLATGCTAFPADFDSASQASRWMWICIVFMSLFLYSCWQSINIRTPFESFWSCFFFDWSMIRQLIVVLAELVEPPLPTSPDSDSCVYRTFVLRICFACGVLYTRNASTCSRKSPGKAMRWWPTSCRASGRRSSIPTPEISKRTVSFGTTTPQSGNRTLGER